MHILVVNDDGSSVTPGLQVPVAEACQTVGHVTVVAPDREQSAQSHAPDHGRRPLRPVIWPVDGDWQVDEHPARTASYWPWKS